jgi:Beta-lactamase superfamily domain
MRPGELRLVLLGVGAMNSPRYRPAGLLVTWPHHRVMLDGGGTADPGGTLDAWLVCDERAELRTVLHQQAAALDVPAEVAEYASEGVRIAPMPVQHTSHPTYGYVVEGDRCRVGWAPEFLLFPNWAGGLDLLFAEAAGWDRPIRFAQGSGGHACVREVAEAARAAGVRRLVFAHIGRPSIRAIDRGAVPPFGEWGVEGRSYVAKGGP